jgi:hypothetical protein
VQATTSLHPALPHSDRRALRGVLNRFPFLVPLPKAANVEHERVAVHEIGLDLELTLGDRVLAGTTGCSVARPTPHVGKSGPREAAIVDLGDDEGSESDVLGGAFSERDTSPDIE